MTLFQQISVMIETNEPQWRAEKLQVVNWGGFHGHASLDFAPEVTVVSGLSGAGKSSILDAYIALMMPRDVPFNGASNDSGSGRARSSEQRNLLSYLRGKLDDTLEDGEKVERVMRGRGMPTWGAVSMTFISESDDRYTAIRAYFVSARVTRSTELTMKLMTVDGEFDLRDLKPFVTIGENHFPPRQLKAKWPEMKTFESYNSFAQSMYIKLGIGMGGDGANALRLLARIQASEDISTVDKLYKDLVLETPDSYKKADAAIEHFDKLEDVYQEMVTAQERADLLEPIIEAHSVLVRAQEAIDDDDELGLLDADRSPAGLWRLRRHGEILARAVEENRANAREHRTKLAGLVESEQSLKTQLAAAQTEREEAGGGLLAELGLQIEASNRKIRIREERRAKLAAATMSLDASMASQEQFESLQQKGREFRGVEPLSVGTLRVKR